MHTLSQAALQNCRQRTHSFYLKFVFGISRMQKFSALVLTHYNTGIFYINLHEKSIASERNCEGGKTERSMKHVLRHLSSPNNSELEKSNAVKSLDRDQEIFLVSQTNQFRAHNCICTSIISSQLL